MIEGFLDSLRDFADKDAIVWHDTSYSYSWLRDAVQTWRTWLEKQAVKAGSVVALEADFAPASVALFVALMRSGCIAVPLAGLVAAKRKESCETAQVEIVLSSMPDGFDVTRTGVKANHELYARLRKKGRPGLVLFSSGSTGPSKASVHDFVQLLEKYKARRQALRTVSFLLFDHIGGINTMLHTLFNGGCVVAVSERSPDAICEIIEKQRAELLPTSPTFLNMILVSEAYKRHDLSSLKVITYGTEMMHESTLRRLRALFPHVRLQQTYGLSEVGILASKSKSSDSLWVKIGGDGFQTRVVDGVLEIKARSAILGYINAPRPFSEDGWLNTGDEVEVSGEYVRFRGRKSEFINVGGQKVHPAEVENVIQEMENVADVAVSAETSLITGQIVVAEVKLMKEEPAEQFRKRMWSHCRETLQRYMIPQKVIVVDGDLHSDRFKKIRQKKRAD